MLIIIGATTLLIWTGVQFYNAITGRENQEFNFIVTPIQGTISEDVLGKVVEEKDKISVPLSEIRGEE